MFAGVDAPHVGVGEEVAVERLRLSGGLAEATFAQEAVAGPVGELAADGGGDGQRRAARVADEQGGVLAQLHVVEWPDHDPIGGHAVGDPSVRGGRRREDALVGELREQVFAQRGAVGCRDAQALRGPPGVPALAGGDRYEGALLRVELAADDGEGGCAAPARERGCPLVPGSPAPDPVAVALVLDVPGQPFVLDRPVAAQMLDDAADPRAHGPIVDAADPVEGRRAGLPQRPPADADELSGPAGRDEDTDGPRGFEGAPVAGLQTDLERGVEEEASPHGIPGLLRDAPAGGGCLPVGLERDLVDERGGHEAVAGEGVVLGGAHRDVDPLGEGLPPVERATQRGAQRHRVGSVVDEAGAVGGVLHRVGEDQRPLLGGVEVGVAEEGRQADGEQGGDGAAEEADLVGAPAGGAFVVAGALLDVGVVAVDHDDGQHPAFEQVVVVIRRPPRQDRALRHVQPAQVGGLLFGVGVTGCGGRGDGGGLPGGVEQRAEAAVTGQVVDADAVVAVGEVSAGGGEGDTPPGSAARAAVDGGQGCGPVAGGRELGAVVGPAESGLGGDDAVDAGQFAQPEGDIDGDGVAVAAADDAQGGEDRGERPAGVDPVAEGGRGEELCGEGVDVRGLVGEFDEAAYVGVGLDEDLGVGLRRRIVLVGAIQRARHVTQHPNGAAGVVEANPPQLSDLLGQQRRKKPRSEMSSLLANR